MSDELQGGDVRLRAATDGDEDVQYRVESDLGTWELRTPAPPRALTREQYRARLAERVDDAERAGFVIEAAGQAVGACSLSASDPLAHHAEVGIALLADFRGRGYGTAALRLLVEFGFERRNLHRIQLGVIGTNAAARACYRKVGFVEEGVLRERVWIRGRWDDEIIMGLLRSEWRAARS